MKKCETVECDEQVSDKSKHGRCALCRANIRNWEKAPVWRVVRRISNLRRYTNRMSEVEPTEKEYADAKRYLQTRQATSSKADRRKKPVTTRGRAATAQGKAVH